MIKVNNFNEVVNMPLDEWIYFLKKSQIKEEFTAQGLALAKENLLVDSLSDAERANYLRFMENRRYEVSMIEGSRSEGRLEGIEEGRLEGIEKGKQQEKINVARKLKQKGTDLDTITEITGLSRKEIEKLDIP
ncbi:MAG: Rpn family recombination-promoting nuclease/putative transposase [Coleofasciculus sp. B1-GNL1-01]